MIKFDHQLLDRDRHYYLGFSGGVDSLAAAKFLNDGGWNITLLHVRHFPTPASEEIAIKAERAAWHLGIRMRVFTPYVGQPEDKLMPSEVNAHYLRNQAFAQADSPVIICSHLNDMGETYFLNMCAGHPDWIPLKAVQGNKIRPFLRTRKDDFRDYAHKHILLPYVVPDHMPNRRAVLRSTVFPTIGQDFTGVCRKLYIDTGKIYEE